MYVNAGFIPYYLLISNIKLKNNFLVYILPYAVQAYFIILIKTYIESIPGELVESAEMDGAGLVKVFSGSSCRWQSRFWHVLWCSPR